MRPKSRAEKSSARSSSSGIKARTKSLMVHFKLPKSKAEKTSVEYPEAGKKRPMVHLKVKPNAELASKPKPKIKLKLKANQRQKSNSQPLTDKPPTELNNAGLFGRLPGELRNKIYALAYGHSSKVRLPRKVQPNKFGSNFLPGSRGCDDIMADASDLNKFCVPALARACSLMRRECLEIYYSINNFVMVFSCSSGSSEKKGLISLRAMAKILGKRINLLKPRALEIRFVEALSMSHDTMKLMAVFFAMLHDKWLKVESDARQIKFSFSVGWRDAAENAQALKRLMTRLFTIGVALSQKPCGCKNQPIKSASSKKRRPMMFDCDKDVEATMNRMMR